MASKIFKTAIKTSHINLLESSKLLAKKSVRFSFNLSSKDAIVKTSADYYGGKIETKRYNQCLVIIIFIHLRTVQSLNRIHQHQATLL